jgi:hypothetical protein
MNYQAIMFHELVDNSTKASTGISKKKFNQIINYATEKSIIYNPSDFIKSISNSACLTNKLVITFDDGMKSQWDFAIPWLEEVGVKAIFFIHTQPLVDGYDKLVCIKQFSTDFFNSREEYYELFEFFLERQTKKFCNIICPDNFLSEYPFYTLKDRRYRYIRDIVIPPNVYFSIIDSMMKYKGINYSDFSGMNSFLQKEHIRQISQMGHLIGLHTHTHPTNISKFNYSEQEYEFVRNKQIIEDITSQSVVVASYPCGRYNEDTLSVLKKLDIKCAFTSSIHTSGSNPLMLPRQDAALVCGNV